MVTATEKAIKELDETEAIIEEFKQRLTRTFLKEKEKLFELADREAKHLLADAYHVSGRLTQKAQKDAEAILEQARGMAAEETKNILSQASLQADKVIKEAEERIRKEARERTGKEVAVILRKTAEEASKQADNILQAAREDASKASRQKIAEAEINVEELMRSARDLHMKAAEELAAAQKKASETVEQMVTAARQTAQAQAEKEAQLIIARAKAAAEKEKEYILASALSESRKSAAGEAESIVLAARKKAEEIVNQAQNKVRNQIEESSRLMQEIHQKMQQVISVPDEAPRKNMSMEFQPIIEAKTINNLSISHETATLKMDSELANENCLPTVDAQTKINSLFSADEKLTHSGKLKIDIAPPSDNDQIEMLEKHLLQNSGLRLIAKGGAADGSAWLEIQIKSPMPLVEFLRNCPAVKDVVGGKSYIIISLNPKQTV